MSCLPRQAFPKTVAVIGGGFAGSFFALKLAQLQPNWTISLIEREARAGRGLAYGACAPEHLLNVPVARMDVGLQPEFSVWLQTRAAALGDALAESGGALSDAFVPRYLFGDYLEQQVQGALSRGSASGLRRIHGEAMAISSLPRQVLLDDGRALAVDLVVLATGNEPPIPLHPKSENIIADPWARGALDGVPQDGDVLLVGTGLTMVDVLLSLQAQGHRGSVHAISRHGLVPCGHHAGGAWRPVLQAGCSPLQALQIVRAHVREAGTKGIPWQRVFDAVRPMAATIWNGWTLRQRAQFLRHLRTLWDVHRHRMAGRIEQMVERLLAEQRLRVTAGRIQGLEQKIGGVRAKVRFRQGDVSELNVAAVINCTGPQSDIRRSNQPLLQHLLDRNLVAPDTLGLGLESDDCVLNVNGFEPWLFALGALTRPAWWEITAVPEIRAQAERLARKIANNADETDDPLSAVFLDIGAGI